MELSLVRKPKEEREREEKTKLERELMTRGYAFATEKQKKIPQFTYLAFVFLKKGDSIRSTFIEYLFSHIVT